MQFRKFLITDVLQPITGVLQPITGVLQRNTDVLQPITDILQLITGVLAIRDTHCQNWGYVCRHVPMHVTGCAPCHVNRVYFVSCAADAEFVFYVFVASEISVINVGL